MRQLRAWLLRFKGLFLKHARERELADELESHATSSFSRSNLCPSCGSKFWQASCFRLVLAPRAFALRFRLVLAPRASAGLEQPKISAYVWLDFAQQTFIVNLRIVNLVTHRVTHHLIRRKRSKHLFQIRGPGLLVQPNGV